MEAASAPGQSTGRHPLDVVFAGGGTGGHTAAGLALAKALTARLGGDVRLAWIGSQSGIEATWVPAAGIADHAIPTGKLRRQLAWRNVTDLTLRVPAGFGRAYALLGRLRPAIVVATGGFVAVPTAVAAAARRLPLLVHEQVVVPGLANRFIGRLADRVAVTFAASAGAFPRAKVVVTGNPVRPELLAATQIVHQCGDNTYGDLAWLRGEASRLAPSLAGRYRAVALVGEELGDLYAAASLVIGRAGAGTVTELAALGLPAILVPLPGARGDEQTANARVLADAGAALLLPEAELSANRLVREVTGLLAEPARLSVMAARARALATPDAAARLVDLVLGLARPRA